MLLIMLHYLLLNLTCDELVALLLAMIVCSLPEVLHAWLDLTLIAGGTLRQMPASAGQGRTYQLW